MTNEFVQNFALHTIHMHKCSSERGHGSLDGDVQLQTSADMRHEMREGQIVYVVSLDYAAVDEADTPQITGHVEFVLVYGLAHGYTPTDEEIQHYAYGGVAFQVHPYLREHVSAVCSRSGLPAYSLPILMRGPEVPNMEIESDDELVAGPDES